MNDGLHSSNSHSGKPASKGHSAQTLNLNLNCQENPTLGNSAGKPAGKPASKGHPAQTLNLNCQENPTLGNSTGIKANWGALRKNGKSSAANVETDDRQHSEVTLEAVQKGIKEVQKGLISQYITNDLGRAESKVGDDAEWEVVEKKRRFKKRPHIVGTKNESTFTVAPKYKYIFASGFAVGTTETAIIDYLKQVRDENYLCERLQTRNGQVVSSFKIGVPFYMKEDVLSPGLWPCGIVVDHFLERLSRKVLPTNQQ